jgi:D-alanyl-D-alanine carboxypeptidase (penicillin-binding protein 5/6)
VKRSRLFHRLFFALALGAAPVPVLAQAAPPAPPIYRPAQNVRPPRGVENDAFARKARAIPIHAGAILSPSWILMDADSGRVLAAKNADKKMFPASTTKTMTALLAVESGAMNRVFRIGAAPPKIGEASVYLMAGEKFKLRDLVKAALIRSANDSCVAIAEAVSGTSPQFIKLMNKRARELGARNTRFQNPHGLHHPQHYTTARDLALIARRAMQIPEFARIAKMRETNIHGNWKAGATRVLLNRNRLLFRWDLCDGVKTGYTKQAGPCLIASATQRDSSGRPWRLIAVVLQSPETWSDAYNLLLHEGFRKYLPHTVARPGQKFALPASKGAGVRQAASIEARVSRAVRVPVREGEDLTPRVVAEVERDEVRAGKRVARAEWSIAGRVVARAPLFALASAPAVSTSVVRVATDNSQRGAPRAPQTQGAGWRQVFEQNRRAVGAGFLVLSLFVALAALLAVRSKPQAV